MNTGGEPTTQSAAYETAIGERKTVLLPDGSEVVLNTHSQLSLSFSSSARVLRLLRGEILVDVAKDPSRPLSVLANDSIIQAVGTKFQIEITDGQRVELMVTEGKVVVGVQPVSVTVPSAISGDTGVMKGVVPPPVLAQRQDNTVSAGEEVTLGAVGIEKKNVTAGDIEVKLSWKAGRLIFRSEPLDKVLQEIGRYTTVEFVLLDENLKGRTISGRFRAGDVEALLASLRMNFNITHEFDENGRVILSSL
jgi:transmembrane sensor